PEVRRIVGEVQPEWLFIENVEGHVDLGFADVAGELRGLGYSVKAGVFSAAEVGAAQFRRRLFALAHADAVPLLQSGRDRGRPRGRTEVSERSAADRAAGRSRNGCPDLDAAVAHDAGDRSGSRSGSDLPLFAPAPSDF